MSWSGGTFSRVHNWQVDKINGIKILAARMDAECDNLAQGVNETINKAGQNTPSANLPMGGLRHTGVGNAADRTDYASAGQVQDGKLAWAAATGSADNIAVTLVPPVTSVPDGFLLFTRSLGANASPAPVLAASGLTARTITKVGGQALVAGDTGPASYEMMLRYNLASTRWELLNPAVSKTVEDNSITYAKLQDIPTDSLIGRDTAGSGDPTAITLDGSLEMTGANVIRRAALTGDATAAAGSNALTLANSGVTANPYGSAAQVATFTVDAKGRLTLAASVPIQIVESQVTDLVTDLANKQPLDTELTALAGLVSAADRVPYFTGAGSAALATFSAFARTLVDDADALTARATLGLTIGTNVQAWDAELDALASVASAADRIAYFTGAGTATHTTLTSFARTLIDDVDAATMRTTLGLVIGTNVQAYDAELAALAGLASAADALPYFTGSGTAAVTTLSSFMRTVLDDANAATAAATLSVLALSGGTLTGALTLSGDGTNSLHAVTKQQLDAIGSGIRPVTECRVATTGAETYTIAGGAVTQIDGTVIDGVTINVNDRIVVKDAPAGSGGGSANSTQPGNGVYYASAVGANITMTRATDADTATEVTGLLTFVTAGSANVGKQFFQNVPAPITLNTTGLKFILYYQPASYVGGDGLTLTGLTLAVGTASSSRIVVNADNIDLATTAVTPNPYGSATQVATFTVDAYGRLTLAGSTSIQITEAQVTNLVADLAAKQALDATLTALAGVTVAADQIIYATGADAFTTTALSAFARTFLDDAAAVNVRSTLGLIIGTDVQAQDATLQSIASLGTAADRYLYTTGVDTWAEGVITAFARTLLDDAANSNARTTLGLVIGTDVQAQDATLQALAGANWAANSLAIGSGVDTVAQVTFAANTFPGRSSAGGLVAKAITDQAFSLLDDASASDMRTTLGLVIGTNVQAQDAELSALAGLASAADKLPYFTGSGTASLADFTSTARNLLDDGSTSAMRTTLGLAIGSDVQAFDAELAALAGLASAADKAPYFTGSGTAALMDVTSFARTFLDDANAAAVAATLSVLALAGGTLTGELILADANHVSTLAAGFRGMPTVTRNGGDYTFALTDSGKAMLHDETTARAWTIPANGSVAFPSGTVICLDNTGNAGGTPGTITLNITTDTLRRGDGTAGTGSRTIGANRVAFIRKTKATEWVITGSFS